MANSKCYKFERHKGGIVLVVDDKCNAVCMVGESKAPSVDIYVTIDRTGDTTLHLVSNEASAYVGADSLEDAHNALADAISAIGQLIVRAEAAQEGRE